MSYHYARLTQDFEHSEVEGPEVFHFVALEGTNDWIEVHPNEPLQPAHESYVRKLVREHTTETFSCEACGATGDGFDLEHEVPGCDGAVSGTAPIRITRRFLDRQGADFVEIGA